MVESFLSSRQDPQIAGRPVQSLDLAMWYSPPIGCSALRRTNPHASWLESHRQIPKERCPLGYWLQCDIIHLVICRNHCIEPRIRRPGDDEDSAVLHNCHYSWERPMDSTSRNQRVFEIDSHYALAWSVVLVNERTFFDLLRC